MAVTFAEEALRAMQDALPLHKAISSTYAQHGPTPNIFPASCCAHVEEHGHLIEISPRRVCLGGLATMVYADYMEGSFLDRGWGMGQLDGEKTAE